MIKKNTDRHKKRAARRRKQQRLKKRQRALQQKLARLAKAQRSFNNLVAALIKASASANGSVDPEPEVCHRLPRLRTPTFNMNLDSRETPQHVRLQPSVVQRLLSLQATPSISQRLTRSLQVEFILPRCEAALLWGVPRRTGSFAQIGCIITLPPEHTPRLLIHLGHPLLSPASSSELFAWLLPLDSKPIALESRAEKGFQDGLPSLDLFPGFPAARWTAADRQAPAARRLKLLNLAPGADSSLRAEQSSSDDRIGWVEPENVFAIHDQRDCEPSRASRSLRKIGGFIRKPFRPAQKRSFRQESNGMKKRQTYFSHPADSHLRIRGWSPSASASLSRRSLRLLGKKEYQKRIHQRPTGRSDGQCGLSEGPTANHTDRKHPPFTPATVVASTLIADNQSSVDRSSPDDKTGWVNRKVIPVVYHQRNCKLPRASRPLRRTGSFIGGAFRGHREPLFQKSHGSIAKQPPSLDAVPVGSVPATIPFPMPGDPSYNDYVAMSRLMHYMVAEDLSLTRAMWRTGIEMLGSKVFLEDRLYGTTTADLPLISPLRDG